jgi:signal peptide peptidase SppA
MDYKAQLREILTAERRLAMPEDWQAYFASGVYALEDRTPARMGSGSGLVAVIPVHGVIMPFANIFETIGLASSVQTIGAAVRAAVEDPEVKAVILSVHSPGGIVSGVHELSVEIQHMRGRKPIVAHVHYMAASAAYWIASAADEIAASPSAEIGSVGVYTMHVDQSGALDQRGFKVTLIGDPAEKLEGNSFEPLAAAARAEMERRVAGERAIFRADVAAGRGLAVTAIADKWARMYPAREAQPMGMIDVERTMSQTLAAYGVVDGKQRAEQRRRRMAAAGI